MRCIRIRYSFFVSSFNKFLIISANGSCRNELVIPLNQLGTYSNFLVHKVLAVKTYVTPVGGIASV